MLMFIKRSSLPKSVSKFMPKKFYENDAKEFQESLLRFRRSARRIKFEKPLHIPGNGAYSTSATPRVSFFLLSEEDFPGSSERRWTVGLKSAADFFGSVTQSAKVNKPKDKFGIKIRSTIFVSKNRNKFDKLFIYLNHFCDPLQPIYFARCQSQNLFFVFFVEAVTK